MSKITCIFLLTVVYLLTGNLSRAQDYDIDIELDIPDTLYLNQNILLEIDLRNKDTIPFNFDVIINFMVSDSIPASIPGDLVVTFADTTSITIPPDSSFEIQKNLFIDPQFFDGNEPNIIIIWPTTANNVIEFDMHMEEVRVEWQTGIASVMPKKPFSIYPNPVADKLYIILGDDFKNISTLKIYNCLGLTVQSVLIEKTAADILTVDLNDMISKEFPQGVYFIVLEGEDRVGVERFIRAR